MTRYQTVKEKQRGGLGEKREKFLDFKLGREIKRRRFIAEEAILLAISTSVFSPLEGSFTQLTI